MKMWQAITSKTTLNCQIIIFQTIKGVHIIIIFILIQANVSDLLSRGRIVSSRDQKLD